MFRLATGENAGDYPPYVVLIVGIGTIRADAERRRFVTRLHETVQVSG
jgi:hypothetical protein